jgi:hypothetical protein
MSLLWSCVAVTVGDIHAGIGKEGAHKREHDAEANANTGVAPNCCNADCALSQSARVHRSASLQCYSCMFCHVKIQTLRHGLVPPAAAACTAATQAHKRRASPEPTSCAMRCTRT